MESWAAHPCRAAVPSWLGLPSLCPRLRRAEQWDLLCLPILRLPGKCSSPEGAPGTGLPCSDSREGSNSLINCQLGDSRVWAKMRDTSLSPQSSRAPQLNPREREGRERWRTRCEERSGCGDFCSFNPPCRGHHPAHITPLGDISSSCTAPASLMPW